ncbi:MAG: hypothetical protein ABGY95_12615 [Rubritalea sp.]|uniref:hypothetical protein n=1 Tax=Rubritalea sp. TaxID=2109375 RepID=UPI003241D3A7
MNKKYIQCIGTFSIALPLLAAIILTGITSIVKAHLLGNFAESKNTYKTEQAQIAVLNELKIQHSKKQTQLKQWNQLLTGDSFTKVNERLRQSIADSNKTKTLQLTDAKRSTRPTYAVNAPRSACEFKLEGTFSEMQRCLTKLECRMPNLMINTMSLNSQINSNLLNLKLNYTIWENAQ